MGFYRCVEVYGLLQLWGERDQEGGWGLCCNYKQTTSSMTMAVKKVMEWLETRVPRMSAFSVIQWACSRNVSLHVCTDGGWRPCEVQDCNV